MVPGKPQNNPRRENWFALREGPVYVIPVFHERIEFAEAVRLALEEIRPHGVAVEYPPSLGPQILRAVARLPQASIVLYESSKGQPLYVPIVPADPLIEAVRWALENNRPVHFVDVDIDAPLLWHERLPDSYAAMRLGHRRFYELIKGSGTLGRASLMDRLREQGMAFRIRRLASELAPLVLVCGMAHAPRIIMDLKAPLAEPMDRKERKAVEVFHIHPESLPEVLTEPPLFHAMYEMRRKGFPPEPEEEIKDTLGRPAGGLRVVDGGAKQLGDEATLRFNALVWCARRCHAIAQQASGSARDLRDLLEGKGDEPVPTSHLAPMDRQVALWRWLQRTVKLYRLKNNSLPEPWQIHNMMRFSRNYALIDGRLLPDFFQWVASAKACVDENFAYELWELGCTYPWQGEIAKDVPTIRVKGEDLWLGMRRIHIRPRVPKARRPVIFPVKKRKKETRPGEWAQAFNGDALCSYPPEDVLIERFGSYLKDKGVRLLSEEKSRVEPFTASLLDGIEMRETIRNWHLGRIYVRESRRVKGGVGAVVVIFDPDEEGKKYPYCMTWHGEHDQESDMAFYATPLGEKIVGPGISRCEYGGFVMTYPPRRMMDVWKDPVYRVLKRKPEVLLAAALDYTIEPNVVYVGPRPPKPWFHTLASRMGIRIIYIPIGQFSSSTLRRLQVFHVLSGYDKRAIAKDYIHKG